MQAVEHVGKKSILVDVETHRKAGALRIGNETYGDVVAASIKALEAERRAIDIPCIDDIPEEEADRIFQEMREHPEECYTLEDLLEARAKRNEKNYV